MVPTARRCLLISLWLRSEGGPHFVALLALPCSASLQYYSLSGGLVSRMGSVNPGGSSAYMSSTHPTGTFLSPGRGAPAPWPEIFGSQGHPSRACPMVHRLTWQLGWKKTRGCSGFLLGLAAFPQLPVRRLRPARIRVTLIKGRHTDAHRPYIPHQAYLCLLNRTLFSNPGLQNQPFCASCTCKYLIGV